MIRLPGLIDPHVHMREPGGTHKEDWDSGTQAGLAGGYTMLLAMPNTEPPITTEKALKLAENSAKGKARIDYGQFLGAGPDNAKEITRLAPRAAGLKMYLNQTFGPLRLNDMSYLHDHFIHWPGIVPISIHAEGKSLAVVLLLSHLHDKPVHICHVASREAILLIKAAKERGVKVTCEVTPHHLFLTEKDIPQDSPGKGEVRPSLGTSKDLESLWENLDVVDCFASDHAPHTLVEKESAEPPPGFPGLETALFLFLTAVKEGRLSIGDIIQRMYSNPRKIYKLPVQERTWVEIDPDYSWEIKAQNAFTRCGWTPFEGWLVHGRIHQTCLKGEIVYQDGKIFAKRGFGRNVREVG